MSPNRVLTLVATAILVVAGCTSSGVTSPGAAAGGASGAPAAVVGTSSTASFGTVLTGPTGLTLYTHAGDSASTSTCDGQCAVAWPPLETTGQPMAGAGVTGQLGTVTRSDGTTQATYGGQPLYYWQGDTKAGDVTGNGVEGFSVATVHASGAAPKATTAPTVATQAPAESTQAPAYSGKYGY
jgi:predicted lipoprotein with Yx(FWY)xxD motif